LLCVACVQLFHENLTVAAVIQAKPHVLRWTAPRLS
jgi:hypothetical protein